MASIGCGSASSDSASGSDPLPTVPMDCGFTPGPATIAGVVVRLSGGVAGFDSASLRPDGCASDEIPIVNLDDEAVDIAESSTDCDDCADSLTTSVSERVELTGVLTSGEGFVFVADGRSHPPETHRFGALDVADVSWDLRTEVGTDNGEIVVCQFDSDNVCDPQSRLAIDAEPGVVLPALDAAPTLFHVRGTTTGDGRIRADLIDAI